jgi:hypothetical protein
MKRGKGKKRDGARKKIDRRLEKRDRAISFLVVFFSLLAFFLLLYSSGVFNKDENNNPPDGNGMVYCASKQRKADACIALYAPVCGWFDDSIQCVKYPCAETYSNSCFACMDEKVEYYTEGECPTG